MINWFIALIVGLLAGWLIEWLIDWRFWQPRNEQLRDALAEAEAQIAALKEARQQDRQMRQELARLKSQQALESRSNQEPSSEGMAAMEPRSYEWSELDQSETELTDPFTTFSRHDQRSRANIQPTTRRQQAIHTRRWPEDGEVIMWGNN